MISMRDESRADLRSLVDMLMECRSLGGADLNLALDRAYALYQRVDAALKEGFDVGGPEDPIGDRRRFHV